MHYDQHLSLTSQWFIQPGCEEKVLEALPHLANEVAKEPGTLMYLVHTPFLDASLQSLPPQNPHSLLFVEEYASIQAFHAHVTGPAFTDFVRQYGDCFVNFDKTAYRTVFFLRRHAGFIKSGVAVSDGLDAHHGQQDKHNFAKPNSHINRHPAVMFEVISEDKDRSEKFYSEVFGWQYEFGAAGAAGFAYVHFPLQKRALLGGIGQAVKDPCGQWEPGWAPGHSFYLQVDDIDAAIAHAIKAGGAPYMRKQSADGYIFAMIKDPDGNPVGLLQSGS